MKYVGANYSQDISNQLQNKITVNLVEPVHMPEVTVRHAIKEKIIRTGQANIHNVRKTQRTILEVEVTAAVDNTAPMKLEILESEIS